MAILPLTDLIRACKRWRDARSKMVNLPVNSPEGRSALNELSEAEDHLSRAIKQADL
jgi:hypothetical protein